MLSIAAKGNGRLEEGPIVRQEHHRTEEHISVGDCHKARMALKGKAKKPFNVFTLTQDSEVSRG